MVSHAWIRRAVSAVLALGALGAPAGCRFPSRLDDFRCKSAAECPPPAACVEGFCVVPAPGADSSMPGADSSMPGTDGTTPGTDASGGMDAMPGSDATTGTDSSGPGTDAAPGCGDGTCDPSAVGLENCMNCSTDCGGCAGGGCGNGTCGGGESCVDCPMDCPGPC